MVNESSNICIQPLAREIQNLFLRFDSCALSYLRRFPKQCDDDPYETKVLNLRSVLE